MIDVIIIFFIYFFILTFVYKTVTHITSLQVYQKQLLILKRGLVCNTKFRLSSESFWATRGNFSPPTSLSFGFPQNPPHSLGPMARVSASISFYLPNFVGRLEGIEPSTTGPQPVVLPLNYSRHTM